VVKAGAAATAGGGGAGRRGRGRGGGHAPRQRGEQRGGDIPLGGPLPASFQGGTGFSLVCVGFSVPDPKLLNTDLDPQNENLEFFMSVSWIWMLP